MSSTSENRARTLAAELFESAVLTLAKERRRASQQAYFPLAPQPGVESYYDEPISRVMQPAEFEFPGGGSAAGLVEAVAALWEAQGETGLAAMAPKLKEIAEALEQEAAEGDGTISILCYTMF